MDDDFQENEHDTVRALIEMASKGRSLIFVPSNHVNDAVCQVLRQASIPHYSTEHEYNAARAALQFTSHMTTTSVVLVATLPRLTTGIRLPADQIGWIGLYDVDDGMYMQATSRSRPHTPVYHFNAYPFINTTRK